MLDHGLAAIGCVFSLIAAVSAIAAAQQRRHGDLTSLSSPLRGALVGPNETQQTVVSEDRATAIYGGLDMFGLRADASSWRSKRRTKSQLMSSSPLMRRHHWRRRSNRGTRGTVERRTDPVDEGVEYPFTLLSKSVYLVTKIDLHSTFNIYFKMKTTHRYGLLFYSSKSLGNGQRLVFAVELWNGHVHYVYGTVPDGGDAGRRTRKSSSSSTAGMSSVALTDGLRVLTDSSPRTLDDNRWHGVSVLRPSSRVHYLQVDDAVSRDIVQHHHHQQQQQQQQSLGSSQELDTSGSTTVAEDQRPDQLFIGGLPGPTFSTLPDKIRSSDGFQGCLASIYLAGRSWSPCEDDEPVDVPDEMTSFIKHGCHDVTLPHEECTSSECPPSGGLCESLGDATWTQCNTTDCGTSEREEDGMAYTFGRLGGLLSYSYPATRRPNTKFDRLSFGFTTIQRDTALVTITSSSYADFIHVELVNGHVIVTYNVGAHNLTIGETLKSLSDGVYHVVRFTRYGPNATLQVDNLPTQTRNPSGRQMVTFNHQALIVVGGLIPSHSVGNTGNVRHIARPFHGTIAGFNFNGLRLLDLAAEGDDRVTITGDVQMEVKPLRHQHGSGMTSQSAKSPGKSAASGADMLLRQLNDKLYKQTKLGGFRIDDLITTTSTAELEESDNPCPRRVDGVETVKCETIPAAVDAFIHPTVSTLGNVTGVSMTTGMKSDSPSTNVNRSDVGRPKPSDTFAPRPLRPCTAVDRDSCAPPVPATDTPNNIPTTTTMRKSITSNGDVQLTPTVVHGLERNGSSTAINGAVSKDIVTSKTYQSTSQQHITSFPRQSLWNMWTTTASPHSTSDGIGRSEWKTSVTTIVGGSQSTVRAINLLPISRGAGSELYPDIYGGEEVESPSLSSSTLSSRTVTISRSLGLVLGLIVCITIAVTVFVVLLIVYRYHTKSTPSRRASLVSVTSLGYSKAPTTDMAVPVACTAGRVKSPQPKTHDCTAIAAKWPAMASSDFYGNDNMASRTGELMGTSVVCATFGAADSAFMTSSMTYGGVGGGSGSVSGCKTSHAKEWFV